MTDTHKKTNPKKITMAVFTYSSPSRGRARTRAKKVVDSVAACPLRAADAARWSRSALPKNDGLTADVRRRTTHTCTTASRAARDPRMAGPLPRAEKRNHGRRPPIFVGTSRLSSSGGDAMSYPPPATQNPEGWAFTQKSTKAHYFRNRRTLCSSRVTYSGAALAGDTTVPADDKCVGCWNARHREAVNR